MTSQVPPRSRLFALLVAINNYPPPIPALRGCINDLQKVASYLEKESRHFELHIHKLIDNEATKANIVKAFTTLGETANNDDVILFYFSGHGTQEDADPLFWEGEADHKLESLVCYDGYTISEGRAIFRLLADKELRYIISLLAAKGSHILTIFDCCHSGGNTRNGYFAMSGEEIIERRTMYRERLSQAFPARIWNDFIFSETISLEEAKRKSIGQCLAEGKHIQIAACQDDESAFEVGGEGVFTKTLLDVLERSEGAVSYYDLQSRIQNFLRHQFKQTPKLYVAGDDESSLFLGFLNKKGETKPLYGNINFNDTDGWVIDFGAMHGLSPESTIEVHDSNSGRYNAKVKEVFPSHSQLVFEKLEAERLNPLLSYRGYSKDYFFVVLKISLSIQNTIIEQDIRKIFATASNGVLCIAGARNTSDYCVEEHQGKIVISQPEAPGVPIIQPVAYVSENSATIIRNYLVHISQFEFVKRLQNPNSFLFSRFPVEILFYQKNNLEGEVTIPIESGKVSPSLVRLANGSFEGSIRIKVKNNTDRKLYCALLYLTFNFGIYIKLLKEIVVGLAPNAEAWASDGASIGLNLEDEVMRYNYKESTSTIKLIVSTNDFKQQVLRFEMPSLPGPLDQGNKGLTLATNNYVPEIQDWTTRNIDIKIPNPNYKA